MNRKSSGCIGAVIPLIIVTCVSLVVVGGIVTWMAAREGNGPDTLVAEMVKGRQSARPVMSQNDPLPTLTLPPLPTPVFVAVPTPQVPPNGAFGKRGATAAPVRACYAFAFPHSGGVELSSRIRATARCFH